MLDNSDDYCKILASNVQEKKSSLNSLINVNIDRARAELLIQEPCLEVRKFRSEKAMMSECAVVKCSSGLLWNIPHKILERVEKNG